MTNTRNLLLTIGTLVILTGSTAQGANVSVSFDFQRLTASPGQTVTFSGTITNLESAIVDMNGCTITLPGQFVFDCVGPFFANAPLTVDANQTSLPFDMFTVTVGVPYTDPFGLRPPGTFTVLGGVEGPGGYDGSTQNILGEASFQVDVVPEPGTATLFCFGVPLAMALRRRWCAGCS
jgi:hypothetical protein